MDRESDTFGRLLGLDCTDAIEPGPLEWRGRPRPFLFPGALEGRTSNSSSAMESARWPRGGSNMSAGSGGRRVAATEPLSRDLDDIMGGDLPASAWRSGEGWGKGVRLGDGMRSCCDGGKAATTRTPTQCHHGNQWVAFGAD